MIKVLSNLKIGLYHKIIFTLLLELSALMGHESFNTTAIYTKSSAEKLEKIRAILDETDEPTDDDEVSDEEGSTSAEDEDEDDVKAATKGRKVSAQADGFAVLDLPEAKGRENLAKALGKQVAAGKQTLEGARELLKASPKGSRLGDAMAGRDINPGNHAGDAQPSNSLLAAAERYKANLAAKR